MAADFTIKAGDTLPILADSLSYSNGEKVNLEGCTLTFTLRSQTTTRAVTTTGTATIVTPKEGSVQFQFSAADSATAGAYVGNWHVTFPGGAKESWPTVGLLTIEIERQPSAEGGLYLAGLPEVKTYLGIPPNDRVHDGPLLDLMEDLRPVIEAETGPILPETYDEWYEGGHVNISLRHRPSFGYGTTPILRILGVSEYRGPIEYAISQVPTPTQASVYAEMLHGDFGTIVRRTAGGGTYNWWRDPTHPEQSVHVTYVAGQEEVPRNVRRAMLELVRTRYFNPLQVGAGRRTVEDEFETGPALGYALPRAARELLEPTRRAPSIA